MNLLNRLLGRGDTNHHSGKEADTFMTVDDIDDAISLTVDALSGHDAKARRLLRDLDDRDLAAAALAVGLTMLADGHTTTRSEDRQRACDLMNRCWIPVTDTTWDDLEDGDIIRLDRPRDGGRRPIIIEVGHVSRRHDTVSSFSDKLGRTWFADDWRLTGRLDD